METPDRPIFADSTYSEILQAWKDVQMLPHANVASTPSEADVRFLTDIAFQLSLMQEEGMPIRATLVLAHPEIQPLLSGRNLPLIIRFRSPVEATATALAKLASAVEADDAAIAIDTRSMAQPEAWAYLCFEPRTKAVRTTIGGAEKWPLTIGPRPDGLYIKADGPGSIRFSRWLHSIGICSQGQFQNARGAWPTELVDRLRALVAGQDVSIDCLPNPRPLSDHMVDMVVKPLVRMARDKANGFTVILTPRVRCSGGGLLDGGYPVDAAMRFADVLTEMFTLRPLGQVASNFIHNRYLAERLSHLSGLACLDGALVLDEKLDPVSFGTKIVAPHWDGEVECVSLDPGSAGGGAKFPVARHGTRHRSAIDFAAACAGALVFVGSSDGPVRAFARDGDVVKCWPDVR